MKISSIFFVFVSVPFVSWSMLCSIFQLGFWSSPLVLAGRLTKRPGVCNSSLIAEQPDSWVAGAQPADSILLLCQRPGALRGRLSEKTGRHFFSLDGSQLTNSSLYSETDAGSILWIKRAEQEQALCPVIFYGFRSVCGLSKNITPALTHTFTSSAHISTGCSCWTPPEANSP